MAQLLERYFVSKAKLVGATWVVPTYSLSSTFVNDSSSSRAVAVYIGTSNSGTLLKTVTIDDKIITGLQPNTTYFIQSKDYATYSPGVSFTTKATNSDIITMDTLHYALAKLYAEGHETVLED